MKSITHGHVKTAWDAVRSAKGRSFWTMLGVIIGVSSVITVVSIGQGIKNQISNQITHYGKDLITVRAAQLNTSVTTDNKGLNLLTGLNVSAPLTAKDSEAIRKTKGVAASAPLSVVTGTVKADYGTYTKGIVIGTGSDLSAIINQSLAYGTFITEEDQDANVAVLGHKAVENMFNEDVPLGRSFTFHGEKFIVKGIFNPFVSPPLSQQADYNNTIFIPYSVGQKLTNNSAPTYAVLVRPENVGKAETVARNVKISVNKSQGGQSGVDVLVGNQNLSSTDVVLDLVTKLIAGIAAISLFVAGVGIMNVMLVSVTERMHEIGIRKALGATNRQILNQFMFEATVLTLTGGIIGIILAYIINLALKATTNLEPVITWQVVIVATVVSLLVGIIFGTLPALKAARKHPIEALRSQ